MFRATEKFMLKKHLQFHRNNKNDSTKRDENGFMCQENGRKRDKGGESDGIFSTDDVEIASSECPPSRKKCSRTFGVSGNGMQSESSYPVRSCFRKSYSLTFGLVFINVIRAL